MSDAIFERVRDLLVTHFDIPADRITPQAQLRGTLGMDSLDVVDLVFFLCQEFGVTEELDDYRDLHTLDKLVAYIARHTGG